MIKQALNNDYIKGDLKVSVKTDSESPIGVFDSGVGGISVLRELVKIMPNEDYLYFGDSINAPYGTKEISRIRELTIKNVEKLMEMGAKSIVVACNTATSAAVRVLRKMYPDKTGGRIQGKLKSGSYGNTYDIETGKVSKADGKI